MPLTDRERALLEVCLFAAATAMALSVDFARTLFRQNGLSVDAPNQ